MCGTLLGREELLLAWCLLCKEFSLCFVVLYPAKNGGTEQGEQGVLQQQKVKFLSQLCPCRDGMNRLLPFGDCQSSGWGNRVIRTSLRGADSAAAGSRSLREAGSRAGGMAELEKKGQRLGVTRAGALGDCGTGMATDICEVSGLCSQGKDVLLMDLLTPEGQQVWRGKEPSSV